MSHSKSHGRGPQGFTSLLLAIITLLTFLQLGSASPSRSSRHPTNEPLHARQTPTGDKYLLGVGKADITGPVVEINFAGYASTDQVGTGLRQRIFSRAFIVGEVGNPRARFVYLVLDTQSGDTALRNGILEGVAALGPAYAVYGRSNIAVTGTHSHSGPGAWFNYLLPQVTSLGFDKQSYQAVVDGAVASIKRAHESLQEVCPPPPFFFCSWGWFGANGTRASSTSEPPPSPTPTSTAAPGRTSPTLLKSAPSTPTTSTRRSHYYDSSGRRTARASAC